MVKHFKLNYIYLLMGHLWPLFHLFSLYQTTVQFYNK